MKLIQVKCLGFYDEEDEECVKHCEHAEECQVKRTQEVLELYTRLVTQSKTSAVTTPIFDHFKQVFEEIEPDTRKRLENAVSLECLKWDKIPVWTPNQISVLLKI